MIKIGKRSALVFTVLFVLLGAVVVKQNVFSPDTKAAPSKTAVYYCPMHPTYTSDKPGDCPICNMTLVKRENAGSPAIKGDPQTAEDICYMHNCPMMKPGQKCPMMVVAKTGEEVTCPVCGTHVAETSVVDPTKSILVSTPTGYAPILVTPQKRQLIGVRTAKVERRVISKTIRAVGRIAYDPELYQAEQEYISSIRAWKEVEKSTSPDAAANAKRLLESSQTRLRLLGLSKELIEEVATWEAPDKSLLLMDSSGKAWLYAPIYEYELPLVKVGQMISIEASATIGKTLTGTIRSIDSVLDPMTRTARVRAVLVDPDGGLKPEMYVNTSIAVTSGEVIAIPEEAIFNTGTKQIVFVDKGDGIFEPRDVKVGLKADGFYELKEGISEDESVVTSGNFLIDSESRLKAALDGMGEGSQHQHG